MTAAPIHLAGHRLLLDPLGGAVWPEAGALIVADLHLEKGTACARRGQLVPPWDTALTLDRLGLLLRRYHPRIVVALGDSFHDQHGPARMSPHDTARLLAMTQAAGFVWVSGNHDPRPPGLPGLATECWEQDGLVFRHEAAPAPGGKAWRAERGQPGEVCGHHHPKASIETRAGRITRPCFVADAHRLMLPALGAYTGGLDVANPAIARLFPRGGRAFLLGQGRLFSFTLSQAAGPAPITAGPAAGPAPAARLANLRSMP